MTDETTVEDAPVKTDEEVLAEAKTAAAAQVADNLAAQREARLAAMRLEAPVAIPANYVAVLQEHFGQAREGWEYSLSDDGTQLTGWNFPIFSEPLTVDQMSAYLESTKPAATRAHCLQLLREAKDVNDRCDMFAVDFPQAWTTYMAAIRAISSQAGQGDPVYPAPPAIPEGV